MVSCKQEVYYNVMTTVEPPEGGSIVMNPSAGQVLEGTSVTFTAQPKGDYVFTGWSGNLTGTENPKTVTVNSDLTVTANFTLREYPLNLSVEGEGTIEEKVISSKADYASGTVVELTAKPAAGWSFDHWEGDLTGADNPITMTISSAKTVKAVFTKNHYAYNLRIVGPGVVDEYLVQETKASLEYGQKVLLKAFPAEGAVFKGWSGDLTGSDSEVVVDIDGIKDIVATFTRKVRTYPLRDLMLPSAKQKCLFYGVDFSSFTDHQAGYFPCDYNRDGYVDLLGYGFGIERRSPIQFFLGTPDGLFTADEKNNERFMGQIGNSRTLIGDYNNDGAYDFFLIGAGIDKTDTEGEYNILLLSDNDGSYSEFRLEQYVGRYTSGGSADIDNDGDLDIVVTDPIFDGTSLLLINDGKGNFTPENHRLNQKLILNYVTELFDIDQDGYVDLLLSDYMEGNPNAGAVIWGNGNDFLGEFSYLPETEIAGMNVVTDDAFFDIDRDGKDEIIRIRTSDGSIGENYQGWAIQIIKVNGRSFQDITSSLINISEACNPDDGRYVALIDVEDVDGHRYITGREVVNSFILFEIKDGRIIRKKPTRIVPKNGIVIYGGNNAIEFNNWRQWDGYYYCFQNDLKNGIELSSLVENNYALEFIIKNEDPSLRVDIKFGSEVDQNTWAVFYSQYRGEDHQLNGDWERIVIPLNEFDEWSDKNENYWAQIDNLHFQISSTGGQPFCLKDIRIRKVLPE